MDWEAWSARSLADEDIVRLILDGTVVRTRLDKKATNISVLAALGVQRMDGSFTDLANDRKRVRIEATLKGAELSAIGVTDIASLKALKVSRLQKRTFQFKLPTFSARSQIRTGSDVLHNEKQLWRARTWLRAGLVGLMAMDRASENFLETQKRDVAKAVRRIKGPRPRVFAGKRLADSFVAWDEMNRKVNVALTALEKREGTAWKKLKV